MRTRGQTSKRRDHQGGQHPRTTRLIEASWHYRHRPGVNKQLRKRCEGQPGWVIAGADRAQLRLHERVWKLTLHGKSTNEAVTALARELAGFIWVALSLKGAAATPRNVIATAHA